MIKNNKIIVSLMIKLGFIFEREAVKVSDSDLRWLANDIALELLAFQEIRSVRILDYLNEICVSPKTIKVLFGAFAEQFREQIDMVAYIGSYENLMENNNVANKLQEELK